MKNMTVDALSWILSLMGKNIFGAMLYNYCSGPITTETSPSDSLFLIPQIYAK